MSKVVSTHPELLGLVEIDRAGTVLYARPEGAVAGPDINGRNFYSEVAPFKNVEDFHRLIDAFEGGCSPTNSFNFTCDFDDGSVPVRVLVARTASQSNGERTKSILIHIRPA